MQNPIKLLMYLNLILLLTGYPNSSTMNDETEVEKLEERLLQLLYKQDKSLKDIEVKFVHFRYVEFRGFDIQNDLFSASFIKMLNPTYYYELENGRSYIRTESYLFKNDFELLAFGDARGISIFKDKDQPLHLAKEIDFIRRNSDCTIYHLMGISKGNYFIGLCKDGMKCFKSEKEGYVEITREEYIDNL